MFRKHLVVIRGGIRGSVLNVQELIDGAELQDDIFISDKNDFSFTLIGHDEIFNELIKRVMGKYTFSIIRTGQLPDYTNVVALGKVMDGALQKRGSDLAGKLFK